MALYMVGTSNLGFFKWVMPWSHLVTISHGDQVITWMMTWGYPLQSGAPKIAKLVQITPMSLWFMVLITIVFMGFINHLTSLVTPTTMVYGTQITN